MVQNVAVVSDQKLIISRVSIGAEDVHHTEYTFSLRFSLNTH